MPDSLFWEVHRDLEREGPGDEESVRRALAWMTQLPAQPRILDVGCGAGAQTLQLSRDTDGIITAVDIHQLFLNALEQKITAHGMADRVRVLNTKMISVR